MMFMVGWPLAEIFITTGYFQSLPKWFFLVSNDNHHWILGYHQDPKIRVPIAFLPWTAVRFFPSAGETSGI